MVRRWRHWLRRPALALLALLIVGNLLGLGLRLALAESRIEGGGLSGRVLAPLLTIQDVWTLLLGVGLLLLLATGWFIARGPGHRGVRIASAILAGALGTALFWLPAVFHAQGGIEAAYPDVDLEEGAGEAVTSSIVPVTIAGMTVSATGAIVPLLDEWLARRGEDGRRRPSRPEIRSRD